MVDSETQLGIPKINRTVSREDAGCAGETGNCAWRSNLDLPNGDASWWVMAKNEYGSSSWSDQIAFSINFGHSQGPGDEEDVFGWDPGLTSRRVREAGVGCAVNDDCPGSRACLNGVCERWEDIRDVDNENRSYTLINVVESGPTPNTRPYQVNDPAGPLTFDWSWQNQDVIANLFIDTTKPIQQIDTNPNVAYAYLGFYENHADNGTELLPRPGKARWTGSLKRDGPHPGSTFPEEDGRVVAGIAWRESGQVYIVELNLHSGDRNPNWRVGPECISSSTHHGLVHQYVVLGGAGWGLPSVSNSAFTAFDFNWGSILETLRTRNDACRLNGSLGDSAELLEIGVAIEVRG